MTDPNDTSQIAESRMLGQLLSRRNILKRGAILGLSVPAFASLLAACGSDDDDDEPDTGSGSGSDTTPQDESTEPQDAEGDATDEDVEEPDTSSGERRELVYAFPADISSLDGVLPTETNTHNVTCQMYETLVKVSRDGGYEGVLAESWEIVDDLTWEFKLREDATFHNGAPFTAHDVVYTFELHRDPEMNSPNLPNYATFETVEAIDDHNLRVVTKEPSVVLLANMNTLYIVSQTYIEEVGWEEHTTAPVGTGPFKFVSRTPGVDVVMEPYEDHWRGGVAISRLIFRPIPEDSTRIAALQNNEVQLIVPVSIDRVPGLEGDENLTIASRPGQGIYGGLDTLNTEPLTDVRVRQAINHAVNVDSIVDDLLLGRAQRVPSALWLASPGSDPDMEPYAYDPERAQQLLEEAGYPDGFDLVLSVNMGIQGAQKLDEIAEAIAADLSDVGINVTIRELDPVTGEELYEAGDFELYLFAWASDHTIGRHVFPLLHSEARGYYYQNPDADVLIEDYMSTLDPDARADIGRELNEFLYEDAPWLFLYQEPHIFGYRSDVIWEPNPHDFYFYAYEVEFE